MGKKYDEKNGVVKKSFAVSPIKDGREIERIKQHLRGSKRKSDKMWLCLFIVGINVGLRASDLTRLRVGDVYDVDKRRCKKEVQIVEKKTGKDKVFILNKAAQDAIKEYLVGRNCVTDDEWLFLSQKGGAPSVKSVNRYLRELGKTLRIPYRLGSHSLRKTFAYQLFKRNIVHDPGFIYTLQRMLNHSSSRVTMRYIGIDAERIRGVYENLNL